MPRKEKIDSIVQIAQKYREDDLDKPYRLFTIRDKSTGVMLFKEREEALTAFESTDASVKILTFCNPGGPKRFLGYHSDLPKRIYA